MLETIAKGFQSVKNRLQGKAELTDDHLKDVLSDVRRSLLEADVEFHVTKTFLSRVREKALGEIVQVKMRKDGAVFRASPYEHFVKICQDELVALMGPFDAGLKFAAHGPTVILMAGLQGSGKTTTAGKLARYVEKMGKKPMLVAADIYRPAAVDQLKVIGAKLGFPVFHEAGKNPRDICGNALVFARSEKRDVVILDTAGRLAIDEAMMQEVKDIADRTRAHNILFVCDAMIGQDAVATARTFNEKLAFDGVILTKLDGDARGGAALSIREVTGKPIKFLGMGESLDKLEEFRPEGLASRILGFGDIVGLMKDFEEVVDEKKAEEDAKKMLRGHFDLTDFLEQVKILKQMGSIKDIFEKMPFFGGQLPEGVNIDDKELVKVEAMIKSMTVEERRNPDIIDTKRVRRITRGSGRTEVELRGLLKRFEEMKRVMKQIGEAEGLVEKIPGLGKLARLKRLRQMQMAQAAGEGGGNGEMEAGGGNGAGVLAAPKRTWQTREDLKARKNKRKEQKKSRKKSRKR
jgi:signal recognition particle subunit SRP54